MKWIKILLKIFFIFLLLFILFNLTGEIYAKITPKINIKSANSYYLYDKDGKPIIEGSSINKWIDIDNINPLVIKATISIEDKNFFKHNGFDYFRILKAMMLNIKNKDIVQGASTITQQYAKNLFLDFGKSWERKWKEMWLTFRLEGRYTKDEILEGYLNTINYGDATYGIGNASKYYFNKDINDLSLAEISILVGIPNSPANFSPIANYDLAKERQKLVLEKMVENNYITEEEKEKAYREELNIYGKKDNIKMSSILYYNDAVMEELYEIDSIPKSYFETGGLKIYTTLDTYAQESLEKGIDEDITNTGIQVAKIMMKSDDGSIIALLGGKNYQESQYNRVTKSKRQPGSTIKPFLYYTALENGFTPVTKFLSEKVTFTFENKETYSPKNSGNIYANKEITMATAIAVSDNIYAVKTNLFLGENSFYKTLQSLGFTNIKDTPSLALGTYEVAPVELAKAYSALSSNKLVKPHLIDKVLDNNGKILYKFKDEDNYIFDNNYTFIISDLLTTTYDANFIDYAYPTCINMVSSMTNKYAVKSGSTDTDAWVAGYTPEIVLVSWQGFDNNDKIKNEVVSSNKESWITSMEYYYKNNETNWYKIPAGVKGVLINPITGEQVTSNNEKKRILYFINGTEEITSTTD